jgi:prepilin-type N-terminal cleavage/methylation domain-containing protein
VSCRRGFTLVETLVTVVVLSLLCLIGFPKLRSAMARNNVRASRTQLVNMVAKARASATITNRRTWLRIKGNQAVIMARPRAVFLAGSDADTIGVVEDLNSRYGTTITTFNNDSVGFDPRGFGLWSGNTSYNIKVAKSGYTDSVVVDSKGRVVK